MGPAHHFIAGSLRNPSLVSISSTAAVDTLISDPSLPAKSCFLGVTVDPFHNRILAVVYSNLPLSFNGLAAYDLQSRHRLFLTPLSDPYSTNTAAGANDVAVDPDGNAYVTNSASNFIWKVNPEGERSVFSRTKPSLEVHTLSAMNGMLLNDKQIYVGPLLRKQQDMKVEGSSSFTTYPVDQGTPYSSCGLNGIVYVSEGYLLVVQSNTGKLFKVNAEDGTAETVLLNKDLTGADGVAVKSDGVVLVASQQKLYIIKSNSSWSEGVVYDEKALDAERFASSVAVGGEERVYVLYGHVYEGVMGNAEREEFSLVEVELEEESEEGSVWAFVLIGLAVTYFMFRRFQMRQLATNMNKKIA
ncbi:LOW QUALITY PROTEIN: hypothetical protein LguiB_025205 [Lonicera macranthoides]